MRRPTTFTFLVTMAAGIALAAIGVAVTGARAWRPADEPAHDQGQDGLEDGVIADPGQFLADLPYVRVLRRVHRQVGTRPRGPVGPLHGIVQGKEVRFTTGPGEHEVTECAVDEGGLGPLESGGQHGADEDVHRLHLGVALGGTAGGQGSRRRVGQIRAPQPRGRIEQGVHPARLRGDAGHGLFDEVVGNGEDQIVLAGEVPVNRGRVRAERAAELGEAESLCSLFVEEPQALLDDQFR